MKYSKTHVLKEAVKHKGFIASLPIIFRMIKAWRKGLYKVNNIDILLPVLGLLYVISPIDILPEIAIPFIGSLDDLAVLALVIPKLMKEVEKFQLWEASNKNITTIEATEVN